MRDRRRSFSAFLERCIDDAESKEELSGVRRIGIDETSKRERRKCMIVAGNAAAVGLFSSAWAARRRRSHVSSGILPGVGAIPA